MHTVRFQYSMSSYYNLKFQLIRSFVKSKIRLVCFNISMVTRRVDQYQMRIETTIWVGGATEQHHYLGSHKVRPDSFVFFQISERLL